MWSLDSKSPLPLWRPENADAAHLLAFTTRRGGVSLPPYESLNLGRSSLDLPEAISENRRRVLEFMGLDPGVLATAGQVHGADVDRVSTPGLKSAVDALVTQSPGLAIAITTADCLPLLLAAPRTVAAAHAGWRGIVAGIPGAVLDAVCQAADCSPQQVTVAIGPSIRSCCYVVGPEVARRFPQSAVLHDPTGLRLDLVHAVRLELGEAGVPATAIEALDACTACEPSWYYSHRRDGARTGRHWAVAALRA